MLSGFNWKWNSPPRAQKRYNA